MKFKHHLNLKGQNRLVEQVRPQGGGPSKPLPKDPNPEKDQARSSCLGARWRIIVLVVRFEFYGVDLPLEGFY